MDDRDFRLLLYLQQDTLQSHASLGRRLGLTAPAVRQRLAHLEERGILRGFWSTVPASRFGRYEHILRFEGKQWSEAEARAALAGPDVVWVSRKHDGSFSIQIYPATPDPDTSKLEKVLGQRGSIMASGPKPPDSRTLTAADWRIIRELVAGPRMRVARLAERTGLTPKTARRRRAQLVARGDLEPAPILFETQEPGTIIFHAAVFMDRLPDLSALMKAIPGSFVVHELQDPPAAYLFCRAEELAGVWAAEARLRSIPGVTQLRLTIDREFLPNVPHLQEWATQELEALRLRRRASAVS